MVIFGVGVTRETHFDEANCSNYARPRQAACLSL